MAPSHACACRRVTYFQVALSKRPSSRASQVILVLLQRPRATSRWHCRSDRGLGYPRSSQASFPGNSGRYFQVALSKRSSSRASQVIVLVLSVYLSTSAVSITSRWRCRGSRARVHPRSCRRCPLSLLSRHYSCRITACANEVSRLPCHPACPGLPNWPSADIPNGTPMYYNVSQESQVMLSSRYGTE